MSSSKLDTLSTYIRLCWRYRHFWVHLAFSDLRARFRRSYLGLLWLTLQPLLLTSMMSVVFIVVLKQPFKDYSVYLFSGLIVWDFITGCFNIGSATFLAAEGYIRQVRLPMIIYPMKALLYCSIVFGFAFSGFIIYCLLVKPSIFSWHWIFLLPFFGVLVLFGAPLTIISAITNIKFRDFQQSITLLLQMLMYASPIMFTRSIFDHPSLRLWTTINPIAALLDLFRDPLINDTVPALLSYAVVLLWATLLWGLASWMLIRNERKIVFYY